MNFIDKVNKFFDNHFTSTKKTEKTEKTEIKENINYTQREIVNYYVKDLFDSVWNGDKFTGSYGTTLNYTWIDYYTLRVRSTELFRKNQYARGLIRRLLTNTVYNGINLEANPIPQLIGLTDEQAIEWAEDTELKWELWGRDAYICDYNRQKNFGELQKDIKQTALISGDCLVILRINKKTGLPCIEIIDGTHIKTPFLYKPRKGNYIKYGVEFDGKKRQVAYHVCVEKQDGIGYEYKRIPAYGEKSGRKIAWLVYGSDNLLDDVRGEPILANMLYMLKDLDRYRDASARSAVVQSLYPFLIKKIEKGVGEIPFGAVRRDETVSVTDDNGITTQKLNFGYDNPGTIHQLPYGMDIANLNTQKSDVSFGKFEEIITNVFAWSLEIPPESLKLLFQSNFAASRQANNELQLLIDKESSKMGSDFLQSIYEEWVISSILNGNIKAEGLFDAWNNNDWIKYNAWLNAEFTGLSRPSVDGLKDTQESELKLKLGITTFDREAKKLSKMKFRTIVQKRRIEKELMERFGIVSSIDENNNGEPVQENTEINQNDMIDMINAINNRLDKMENK